MENNLLFCNDYSHVSDLDYFLNKTEVFMENVAKPANSSRNQIR
jgi:hypothetical protein